MLSLSPMLTTMSTLDNSTLRVYTSFAELHQEYRGTLRFRQTNWNNIKHESIILRSSSLQNYNNDSMMFERRIIRTDINMTDRTVFVRKYPEHKYPVLCKIINVENNYSLVRENKTGHYFHIHSSLIEYLDEPQSESIYEVSFYPIPLNRSLTVSYIIKNLRWQTRYILHTFSEHSTQFQILVDLINSSPLTYHSSQTHLMSDNISLIFDASKRSSLVAGKTLSGDDVEYNDIHLFSSITNAITIDPYSILTLPIHSPYIKIEIFFAYTLVLTMPLISLNNIVSTVSSKHKFQRVYQLSNSSSFLPSGHLLLYDSPADVFIGEWHLPTLVESEKYQFKLGKDPDVTLIYNQTIAISQKTNSSLITTKILIQNYKKQNVNVRFKSICELYTICLFYDNNARGLGSHLYYELILDATSEVVFSFTTVRLV